MKKNKKKENRRHKSPFAFAQDNLEGFDPGLASQEVQDALENLARAGTPDQIRATGQFKSMAGILACESVERGLNRDAGPDRERYELETLLYSGFHPDMETLGEEIGTQNFTGFRRAYCMAIANNVVGRALAYLAVGAEGVNQLRKGHAPFDPLDKGLTLQYRNFDGKDMDATMWSRYFERHHRGRKSSVRLYIKTKSGRFIFPEVDDKGQITNLKPGDSIIEMPINTVEQLVLICGGPSPEKDFHAYYHGAFQLAQEGTGIRKVVDGIHATGLFYPCVSETLMNQRGSFHNVDEIRKYLRHVAKNNEKNKDTFINTLQKRGFFDIWAEKIVAFCEAIGHEPLQLTPEEQVAMQAYRYVYEVHNMSDEEKVVIADINNQPVESLDYKYLTPDQRRYLQNSRRYESKKISDAYAEEHFFGPQAVYQMPQVNPDWQIMPVHRWENYEEKAHLIKLVKNEYEKWMSKEKPQKRPFKAKEAFQEMYLNGLARFAAQMTGK